MPEILLMETTYHSLGNSEKGRFISIVRILFGTVCLAVAAYWLIYNIKATEDTGSIWVTVMFLSGFGFYLIWAGAGKADRFIEIKNDSIFLKKYIFLPGTEIPAGETGYAEIYPLKVCIVMKSGKKVVLRFGTTYYESNQKIITAVMKYCSSNGIELREIDEQV